MSIKSPKQFIGDENFTNFITTKKIDSLKFSINCCQFDMTDSLKRLGGSSCMIRLEGRSYLFFNSNTTFFSNEPLKSTDNIIIEYEEEYSKIITKLEKNHPELSKLEVLNKYIQCGTFTTILLNEKNGMYYTTEKDYKYRVLIDITVFNKIALMPQYVLRETPCGDFKLLYPYVSYSATMKEFYPNLWEKIEYCQINHVITYDLFLEIISKCVANSLQTIIFPYERIFKDARQYTSYLYLMIENFENKKKVKHLHYDFNVKVNESECEMIIKDAKTNPDIIVTLIRYMNYDYVKNNYYLFDILTKEKIKTSPKIKEKKEIIPSPISVEEANKNAQELIDEEERIQKKKQKKKKTKKSPKEQPDLSDKIKESLLDESKESIQLPDFFGTVKDELLCELDGLEEELEERNCFSPIEEELLESTNSSPIEEELLNELEKKVLDPMVNDLLQYSDVDILTDNSYCQVGSEEHLRRMQEWDLTKIIPNLYCLPKEYLISMFSQRRYQPAWSFDFNYKS